MTLLEKLNKEDLFANGVGAQIIEIREGYARATLKVERQHLNGGNVCQGGAIYTLADLAFAAVINCRAQLTLGISNTITFLRSAQLGDTLTAECREVYNHHRLPYCDIKVCNQDGDIIAAMTGLGYRVRKDMEYEELM